MEEKIIEGNLIFDEASGLFWIAQNANYGAQLKFGDEFEVKVQDQWVKTSLAIDSDENGGLIFRLVNTPYSGNIDGIEARK